MLWGVNIVYLIRISCKCCIWNQIPLLALDTLQPGACVINQYSMVSSVLFRLLCPGRVCGCFSRICYFAQCQDDPKLYQYNTGRGSLNQEGLMNIKPLYPHCIAHDIILSSHIKDLVKQPFCLCFTLVSGLTGYDHIMISSVSWKYTALCDSVRHGPANLMSNAV